MADPVVLQGKQITDYQDDRGNRIIGTPHSLGPRAKIVFKGSNNTIQFGDRIFWDVSVGFKNNGASVTVGNHSQGRGGIEIGADASVIIGARLYSSPSFRIVTDDGARVYIGEDCMFGQDVSIRSYDNHPIYDLTTRDRINFSRDITIESDVWLGAGVTVAGGAVIGHGSVVGTMSVVTASRPIGEHCLAVGQPATVKRERVAWAKPGDPPVNRMLDGDHAECLARLSEEPAKNAPRSPIFSTALSRVRRIVTGLQGRRS